MRALDVLPEYALVPKDVADVSLLVAGVPFPKDFETRLKNVYKRLFRVYAHMYHSHIEKIITLGAEPHLNTCFKHFMYFILEFSLVERKELEPLAEICKVRGVRTCRSNLAGEVVSINSYGLELAGSRARTAAPCRQVVGRAFGVDLGSMQLHCMRYAECAMSPVTRQAKVCASVEGQRQTIDRDA